MIDERPDGGPTEEDGLQATFGLKPGISFCRVAGRTLFLDVVEDRYFCLSPSGDDAFTRLLDDRPLAADGLAILRNLTIDGPLSASRTAAPIAACPAIKLPISSLLDQEGCSPGLVELAAATAGILAAPVRVRVLGLARALAALRRRKVRRQQTSNAIKVAAIAAAFERLRFVATERDNCLTRSLAVAMRVAAAGAAPDLVIAVKLQPFAAHAWVQCGDMLVNDRHEFVREFTPILIA